MSSLTCLLASIFLILIKLLAFVTAKHFCINDGNYTSNSAYRANLNALLSDLSTNVDDNGFYNASVGQTEDRVYASVLCRGDLQLDACRSCVQNAASELLQLCPNQKKAILYSELVEELTPTKSCALRYSNESMFGIRQNGPPDFWPGVNNSPSYDKFYEDLTKLLDNLRDRAASGGSLRKVAAASRATSDAQTIYALQQCTPDLSLDECVSCLRTAAEDITSNCTGKTGCRILAPSCNLRFETTSFYNETRLQELELPGPPDPSTRNIIIIVASIAACLN